MEIDINQQAIAIGDKYKIFTDGQQTHTASKGIFQLLAEINLFDNSNGRPRMAINKRFAWFKAKYDITRWDNVIYQFRTVSYWRPHYQCRCGNDTYDIYAHSGRKYSIYKNGKQVAWWNKKAVTWFDGDNYNMLADKDCDANLLISFCLIIDNFSSNDERNKNTVNFNFGNIFQAKKFDENWQPKY